MSVIGQVHGSVFTAAYEPKLRATESKVRKDEKIKDSIAFGNQVSANSSKNNIAALKKIVEGFTSIRNEKISAIKPLVDNGTYSIEDKLDKISDSIIKTMFS